jgi:hypothetical protein
LLDHIHNLGKKILHHEVTYYSVEDDCDAFAGIYGVSIGEKASVNLEDLKQGVQPMLTLNLKSPDD